LSLQKKREKREYLSLDSQAGSNTLRGGRSLMAETIKGELVRFSPLGVATSAPVVDLSAAFLSGRNARTLLAYRKDLEDFQAFTGAPSIQAAGVILTSQGSGPANALALTYRVHLQERGLAPKTINRRLSALRSMVKLGRVLGVVSWSLEVEGIKDAPYRDTRGCGVEGFRKMLELVDGETDPKSLRDRAILRLLFGMVLRRGEVCSLDLCHLDLEGGRLSIMGKGRTQRESLTIPPKVLESLKAWVSVRGEKEGPLFPALDRGHAGHRLDGSAVYKMVSELGKAVGLVVRPHGLRHAGITAALDATNGNTRTVQRFSRHKKLETLSLYDDARQDLAGEVARLVDLGA
jgi:integrase/recombinase XerC